eukprot:scaffold1706_cov116-Cylindrotheca_fusiformis.AAC.18
MLRFAMTSNHPDDQKLRNPGPKPLHRPPSLVQKKQRKRKNDYAEQIDQNYNNGDTGLGYNDFFQQPPRVSGAVPAAQSPSQSPQVAGFASNQQNNHVVNLEGQLLSSLASQLMSQRSIVRNYDLPVNNPLLSRFGQHIHHQSIPVASNQSAISFLDDKMTSQRQADAFHLPEHRQQPTFTRVPCQARGMSTDHNALTAYLEIPTDATHGLHLMCSHPTCRSFGVKFRYCLYCKKPVTKQNFRSRHLHADLSEKAKKEKAKGPARRNMLELRDSAAPRAHDDETGNRMLGIQLPSSPLSPTHSRQTSITSMTEHHSEPSLSPKSDFHSLLGAVASLEPRESNTESDDGRSSPLEMNNSILVWRSLLEERPSNVQNLPGWIAKIISCSDQSRIGLEPKSDRRAEYSLNQESMWESLLWERPNGNRDDGEFTSWLVKVLKASDPANNPGKNHSSAFRRSLTPLQPILLEKDTSTLPGTEPMQHDSDLEPDPKKRKT